MPEHPEITFRRDALLCSINDRLGAFVETRGAGADIAQLTRAYLGELVEFAIANSEDVEADLDEARQKDRHG